MRRPRFSTSATTAASKPIPAWNKKYRPLTQPRPTDLGLALSMVSRRIPVAPTGSSGSPSVLAKTLVDPPGRTARAGKKGISIVIASNRQKKKINSIERMISKDFLTDDVPSNEMIIEKQIVHMAESVILTEKNDQIDKFLTDILKKFKKIKKDDIINKFITLEFNKLLSYYNKNKDVKSEKSNNNVHDDDRNMSRFHINIGKKNGLEPQYLLGIINEKLKTFLTQVTSSQNKQLYNLGQIYLNYLEEDFHKCIEDSNKLLLSENQSLILQLYDILIKSYFKTHDISNVFLYSRKLLKDKSLYNQRLFSVGNILLCLSKPRAAKWFIQKSLNISFLRD